MFSDVLLFLPIVLNNGVYTMSSFYIETIPVLELTLLFPADLKSAHGRQLPPEFTWKVLGLLLWFPNFNRLKSVSWRPSGVAFLIYFFHRSPPSAASWSDLENHLSGFPGIRNAINTTPPPTISILGSLENQKYWILLQQYYWSQAHGSKCSTQDVRVGWKESLLYFGCWPPGGEKRLKSKSHLPLCPAVDRNFWGGVSGGPQAEVGGSLQKQHGQLRQASWNRSSAVGPVSPWLVLGTVNHELMPLNCGVGEDSWLPWTGRRSNQSILKEISPEYLLQELMLKL